VMCRIERDGEELRWRRRRISSRWSFGRLYRERRGLSSLSITGDGQMWRRSTTVVLGANLIAPPASGCGEDRSYDVYDRCHRGLRKAAARDVASSPACWRPCEGRRRHRPSPRVGSNC
jgi:hypothetical protein